MDSSARLTTLAAKHAKLEQAIEEEMQRPLPDTLHLSELKREKLRIKDEIAKLGEK